MYIPIYSKPWLHDAIYGEEKWDWWLYEWKGVTEATDRNLNYNFKVSVIPRVARSNRLLEAEPVTYFRIRKVFNLEVLKLEHLKQKNQLPGGKPDLFRGILLFRIARRRAKEVA